MQRVRSVYHTPGEPYGFSGFSQLFKTFAPKSTQEKRKFEEDLRRWLESQDSFTLFKPIRRKFKRQRIFVSGSFQQWQLDLLDFQKLKKYNDGVRYVLCSIDVFSKLSDTATLFSKKPDDVSRGLEKIINGEVFKGIGPFSIQTDLGNEFRGVFQMYLKEKGIHHFFCPNPKIKCSIVERFQRTLRLRLAKYLTDNVTLRYVDVLPDVIRSYNNRYHRSIKMRPKDVTLENQAKVFRNLYPEEARNPSSKFSNKQQVSYPNLKVGDYVRIEKDRGKFGKEEEGSFTPEIFKIVRVSQGFFNSDPLLYTLEDMKGEKIMSRFYKQELSRVQLPKSDDSTLYKIEKVLKRRVRRAPSGREVSEVLVKWLGWPSQFNSWIDENSVRTIV